MKYQTVIMSVLFSVGLSCKTATAYDFAIPGDSSHNWRDVDNADNAVDGSWWKTSSAWCAIPNQPGANAHVYGQNGKSRTLIIPANETITSNDVSVIYVNVNKTSAPATLIVRGVITNGVGIVVGGTGGNGGHYGNVVIDGGRATLGGVLSGVKTAKSLIVSSPNSGIKSWDCGIAVTNGFLRLTAAQATLASMTNCYARMDVTNSILIVEEGLKVGPGNTIITSPAVLRGVRDDSNTHSEFTVSGKSRVSLSGLTLGVKSETEFAGETEVTGLDGDDDFPVVEMSLGAKLRLSDRVKVRANIKCNDGTTYPAGQAAHAPMTNVIELAGGSLVSSKGGFASSSARIPLRFVQTGGAFTNLASMTFACPHALVDIEKGEYRVDHNGGLYAGMVPSKPYFLRKRGLSVVSLGFLGVNSYSSTEQATASYVNEDNIIFEQVIDEDVLKLRKPVKVNCFDIREDITGGQFVAGWKAEARQGDEWKPVAEGSTIGYRRLARFDSVEADEFRVVVTDSIGPAKIQSVALRWAEKVEGGESEVLRAPLRGKGRYYDLVEDAPASEIVFRFRRPMTVSGFHFDPKNNKGVLVDRYAVFVSDDGKSWKMIREDEFGNIAANPVIQHVWFEKPLRTTHVKVEALRTADGSAPTLNRQDENCVLLY